jgi:transposase-like protein
LKPEPISLKMRLMHEPDFDDEAAVQRIEAVLWPDGPVCPHCGEDRRLYRLEGVRDRNGDVRHGLRKCGACRRQFTVRIGTAIEGSHVPLAKWVQAIELVESGPVNAHQLHRILGVTYRTARMMARRLDDIADATGRGGSLERRFARRPYFVASAGAPAFPWPWSAGTPGALGTWIA